MADKTENLQDKISEIEERMKSADFWQNQEEARKLVKELNLLKAKTGEAKEVDKKDAFLEVFSGAGGVDAQDWAAMLLRMYQRWAEKNNFNFKILHQSFGEKGGIKSATAELRGKFAYGKLKKESGVHRLVRISPFSAKNLRHTSFALVDFLPLIE